MSVQGEIGTAQAGCAIRSRRDVAAERNGIRLDLGEMLVCAGSETGFRGIQRRLGIACQELESGTAKVQFGHRLGGRGVLAESTNGPLK